MTRSLPDSPAPPGRWLVRGMLHRSHLALRLELVDHAPDLGDGRRRSAELWIGAVRPHLVVGRSEVLPLCGAELRLAMGSRALHCTTAP
jgi:hypothetical protein